MTDPTVALFEEDGHHIVHLVPATVDSVALGDDKLVDVTWDRRKLVMFTEGLAIPNRSGRGNLEVALAEAFSIGPLQRHPLDGSRSGKP